MKKLLLLGGSPQQVIAITKAKELGCKTILCDFLPDNPGQYEADVFYQESTTDKEAILKIAKKEKIDGIVAYASDPAAPTAAYVAEKMNLPGNPYKSVETLCNKDLFRKFLRDNDFSTPRAKGYGSIADAQKDIQDRVYNLPIIVKPVDSSGSKGVIVIENIERLEEQLDTAMCFSRCNRIIVEEFIVKEHPYLIGGDIFVEDGKVILWGLMNCHRDSAVNSLVPVGKSYPLELEKERIDLVKKELQRMIDKLQIQFGALNVELILDKKNNVYLVDVGPRNGGNMIPDLLGYIFNVDVIEMTIKTSLGEKTGKHILQGKKYYATHNLHTKKDGVLDEVIFSKKIEQYIFRKNIYKKRGDHVSYFDNAAKAIGIIFMKFDSEEMMLEYLEHINQHILIDVCKCEA